MLVCAFLCATCTRDRGCSAHPAFPAPSMIEGTDRSSKARANHAARRRTRTCCLKMEPEIVFVVPDKRAWRAPIRDPYAAAVIARRCMAFPQSLGPVVMGRGSRPGRREEK